MARDIRYIRYMDIDGIKKLSPGLKLSSTFGQWALSARTDQNGVATIVFKKNTPEKILRLFDEKHEMLPFPAHEKYQLER